MAVLPRSTMSVAENPFPDDNIVLFVLGVVATREYAWSFLHSIQELRLRSPKAFDPWFVVPVADEPLGSAIRLVCVELWHGLVSVKECGSHREVQWLSIVDQRPSLGSPRLVTGCSHRASRIKPCIGKAHSALGHGTRHLMGVTYTESRIDCRSVGYLKLDRPVELTVQARIQPVRRINDSL